MSTTDRKYPIPPGFTWNHVANKYLHEDGRCWNDDTNVQYDRYGAPIKTTVELPISPKDLVPIAGAPRVTQEQVDAQITDESYTVLPSGRTTVCEITMKNGFTVRGESSVVSLDNFDAAVGRKYAREDAVRKIWPLLGYALREETYLIVR